MENEILNLEMRPRESCLRYFQPENERKMAKRANAKTIEVSSSHAAYISHPKERAKLIEEAATSRAAAKIVDRLRGLFSTTSQVGPNCVR